MNLITVLNYLEIDKDYNAEVRAMEKQQMARNKR